MKKVVLIFMLFLGIFGLNLTPNYAFAEEINKDDCVSYYVSDFDSGIELYSKNKHHKHEIASMVKIMTLSLVFDEIKNNNLKLDDIVYISSNAESMGGSQLYLEEGSSYKVSDLIEGVAVCSANDASVALAEKVGGSEENFIRMMNDKAKRLGMNNTKYVNPTGLPSDIEQYSTAYDVNIITRDLMKNKEYYSFAKIWDKNFEHNNGKMIQMTNTNKLLKTYEYCLCGKTGFTNNAGFCLSAGAQKDNLKVVATLIGGKTSNERFNKVKELFNNSFSNYSKKIIFNENDVVANISFKNSKQNNVDVYVKDNIGILCNKDKELESFEIIYFNKKAPLKKDDQIGLIRINSQFDVKEYPIYLKENVDKKSFIDYIKDIMKK